MLIVMAGLPGAGKSAVASRVAYRLGCVLVSVDPIEVAMWRSGIDRSQPTGLAAYVVAETIAREQLRLGQTVILDAVNDAEAARQEWVDLASEFEESAFFVEVYCSDRTEHRRRLESRKRGPGFPEPSWESLAERRERLDAWIEPRLRLDSIDALDANVTELLAAIVQ